MTGCKRVFIYYLIYYQNEHLALEKVEKCQEVIDS